MRNIWEVGPGPGAALRLPGTLRGAPRHDDHLPCQATGMGGCTPPLLTSGAFSASRTELYLHQMADSSSFGMGIWPKVRERSFMGLCGCLWPCGQDGRVVERLPV